MKWTILGSGGCTVIPRPFCRCRVCRQARISGHPYTRSGPAAFLQDIRLLIDTPAEIVSLLNRFSIPEVKYLLFTHFDPDHVEGFRVVEQIALDYRSWRNYPDKQVRLIIPDLLRSRIRKISSQYGPLIDFYESSGFLETRTFHEDISINGIDITAIPVDRGNQTVFIYVFQKAGAKVIYAPCDIKPFPENRPEVRDADVLVIQPGIFEDNLKHGYKYPPGHISRTTLYTFPETLELSARLNARRVIFTHLEEYWYRSYDDYRKLEREIKGIRFAFDGMQFRVRQFEV